MNPDPIAVTIPVACQMTALGRSKLYQELSAGRLKACKAGKRTLVLVESIRNYVASLPAYQSRVNLT